MEGMNGIIADAVQNIVLLAIPVIGGFIVKFAHRYVSAHHLELAADIAATAVDAAEQYGFDNDLFGSDKFDYAIDKATVLAAKVGIDLTAEQWAALIEAAVLELKRIGGELVKDDAAV